MTMFDLTDDLWFLILLRLSVKDLLASKCVCKSWLAIISSCTFVATHLRLSISSGEHDETLIVHHQLNGEYQNLELQGCGPFSLSHLTSGNVLEQLELPYSEGYYVSKPILPCRIIGSDCGIVCVAVEYGEECDIYLWNPATKLSKLIAQGWPSIKRQAIGFGFDHTDFDCKVVQIVSTSSCAQVYSSNRNAWRKMEPVPVDVPMTDSFVCLHGFLLTTGHKGMMAFDLNKEVFIFNIKLPGGSSSCVTEYSGSIAASLFQKSEKKVKLWTLDNEACLGGGGVEASWTMKLSCDVGEGFDYVGGLFNSLEFLLVDSEADWFLYNPVRTLRGPLPYCGIVKHTKSLYPVAGSKPVKWTASPWRQLPALVLEYMETDEESIPTDID